MGTGSETIFDGGPEVDVLEQGSSYEESGAVQDAASDDTEKKSFFKKDESDTNGDEEGKKNTALIVGIVAGVIVLILAIVFGSIVYSKKKEAEEQARMEELLAEENVVPFTYTSEEIDELRLNGYTGDEIEAFEFEEIPAQQKIDEATAERKALYDKEIAPYYDMATEEFKKVYANTWLGQTELTFDPNAAAYIYMNEIMNVDYEKLPARGHQLFIKFFLVNGDSCFMTVTPERYMQLADTGNIVLSVKYTQTGDGKRIITDVDEVTP